MILGPKGLLLPRVRWLIVWNPSRLNRMVAVRPVAPVKPPYLGSIKSLVRPVRRGLRECLECRALQVPTLDLQRGVYRPPVKAC